MATLAAGGWLAAALGTWGTPASWAAVGALVVAALLAAYRRRSAWLLAVAVVAIGVGGSGAARAELASRSPLTILGQQHAFVRAVVEVGGDPRLRPARGTHPPYITLTGVVSELEGRGARWRIRDRVLVVVSGPGVEAWSGLPVGSSVGVTARVQSADRGEAEVAVLRVRGGPTRVQGPSSALALVERVRAGLRGSVADRRPEPRALVPALVLGDVSGLTSRLRDDFQTTGLTHLTAVSGANLTLLLAFLLLGARWAGIRGRGLRAVGLVAVLVFVALCRTEPSVLRAAAMGLVALAALGSGARAAGLRNLAVAMSALLLLDPYLARSVGFVLSVLASGGIVCWARAWAGQLGAWLPRPVAELVSVPLAAHLATLPVVAAISGQVSVSGLITNAVTGPFVGPATVLGFAAAGLSQLSPTLALLPGFAAAWVAQVIIWVAHAGAALPGSARSWPVSPLALGYLAAGCLAAAWVMPFVLARRWLSLVLAVLMILVLLNPPYRPGWPPRDWVLVACDVGQGDGLVVRSGRHEAVVFDTGPEPAPMDACLSELGIRTVPLVVLTHFHADHVGGLAGVFDHRTVGAVWVSPLASPAAEAAGVAHRAAGRAVPELIPPVGTSGTVGTVGWQVLGPRAGEDAAVVAEGESGRENDASLVLLVRVAGLRLLLTGDVEPPGQRAILATGADLRADVLKVPHHGSARQDPDFLAATRARIAIASAGVDNDYGHPAPSTVARLRSLGMTVLATNEHGAVAVSADQGRVSVVTQR